MNFYSLITLALLAMFQITSAEQNAKAQPDTELQILEHKLEILRVKALNEEMEAQQLMRSNWQAYLQKIEAMEKDERQILELKKRIAVLKNQQAEKSKN